jgi:putative hydrolase of the HAD superfamily
MRDIAKNFATTESWVFDLDNTLYPPSARLFDQIEVKMEAWIRREIGMDQPQAKALRAAYWAEHGTTLAGLMAEHHIDPWLFLREVHDIDLSALAPAPELARAIQALPGRRIVYTNGDAEYAQRVLEARGLAAVFDAVYGIEHAGFRPKPHAEAFAQVFAQDGLAPEGGAMFEDDLRNLAVPHALGMRTVLVAETPSEAAHVHHHTDDLPRFLTALLEGLAPDPAPSLARP